MFSSISRLWSRKSKRGEGQPYQAFCAAIAVCKDMSLEGIDDVRLRKIKYLIKLNHTDKAAMEERQGKVSSNITPNIIIAAYRLNLTDEIISKIFDSAYQAQAVWDDSPAELSEQDWMDYIGQADYQRAFLYFYEDIMVENGYDWYQMLYDYLFAGDCLLLDRWYAGYGAPLIRLRYALQTGSKELAVEALTLFSSLPLATDLHLPDCDAFVESNDETNDMLHQLKAIEKAHVGDHQPSPVILNKHEISSFRIVWKSTEVILAEMHLVALRLRCSNLEQSDSFSWLLQTAHALRILQPLLSIQQFRHMLSQWWWQVVRAYLIAGCPRPLEMNDASTAVQSGKRGNNSQEAEMAEDPDVSLLALRRPEILPDWEIVNSTKSSYRQTYTETDRQLLRQLLH